MKTLVIGLGNPILTDDGVGVYAARAVRRLLPPEADVHVVELAAGGLRLMEAMIGYERVILIDAIWSSEDDVGQVMQFTAGDLPPTMNSASAHDADLPTALKMGRQLGASLPADDQIQIVGVKARQVLDFGEALTPPVLDAVPQVVARIMEMLGYPPPTDDQALESFLGGGYDGFS